MKLLAFFLCLALLALASAQIYSSRETTEEPRGLKKRKSVYKPDIYGSLEDGPEISTPEIPTTFESYSKYDSKPHPNPATWGNQPVFWGLSEPRPGSESSYLPSEPDIEKELLDGTSVKSKLVGGKPQSLRCRCKIRSAFKTIQGESFNESKIAVVEKTCGRTVVGRLYDKAMFVYHNIDFGSEGKAKALLMLLSNGSPETDITSKIKLYVDNPFGQPIAKFYIHPHHDWCKFFLHKVYVDEIITGIHDLYFVVSGEPDNDQVGAMDMDWFVFTNSLDAPNCPKKD